MKKRILRSVNILIIAFALTLVLHIQQTNKYKDWESTQGVVYNLEEVHSKRNKGQYRLYYTYEVNGIAYNGVDAYSGELPEHYYIGQKVNIMYDESEPSNSLHEKPRTELITSLPMMWLFPIALISLLPRKEKQKNFGRN